MMGTGNNMNGDEFADSLSSSGTGIGSGFNSTDVTTDHNGNISTADMYFTDQSYVRSFDHGISCFDGANQTFSFNHT